MRTPATAMRKNLMFTRSGTVWASFRLQPVPYGYCPVKIKKTVKALHQALFQAFEGEALLSGLTADVDPASVVEQMIEGVDLEANPSWADEVLETLNALEDIRLGTRAFWLSVPLQVGPKESLQQAIGVFQHEFAEMLALPQIVPSAKMIDSYQQKADQIEKLIPSVFKPRKATPAEHIWMGIHHEQRGLGADGRVPTSTLGGDVTEEIIQMGSSIPNPWLDEAGQSDVGEGKIRNPFERRYLKVAASDTPSYQVLQAVSATPKGGMMFPGTEWLYLADSLPLDVDFVLRLTITGADIAKRQNTKAEATLADQYWQRTDEGITGSSSELDAVARDLSAFQSALNRSDKETKVQMTAIFAVGARTAQEAKDLADQVARFYSSMELVLEAPLGGQEELWWGMQVGIPTSRQVREYAQLTTGRDLAGAIPLASTELGATKGSLVAMNISTERQTPVLLDIGGSMIGNKSGSFGVCAELGAGKSFFLKKQAGDVIDRNGSIFVIDRSGTMEWAHFGASVTDCISLEIANPQYSLDPLRIFGALTGASMVETVFTTLLNIAPTDDMGIILSEVMDKDYLLQEGIESLGGVLKHLSTDCQLDGAKELARRMNAFARKKLGKVLFDGTLPPLPLDAKGIVMCTRGTELPSAAELGNAHLFAQLSVEKIFGRSLYALMARIGKEFCFRDVSQLSLFIVDEAHHITLSTEGIYVVETFVREGRKHKAAIGLGSHDAQEDFGNEVVRGLIPVRIVMRHTDRNLAIRALDWLGLDSTDEDLVELVTTDLSPMDENNKVLPGREGEGLMRDAAQRYGKLQILRPARDERYQAILSTPDADAA
ncbi:ATP-binding protein (plasmid) [Micrococcaceae bacterium Sec5.7]